MTDSDSKIIERLLKGLTEPEIMQAQQGKDGDPQLAALSQYLLTMDPTCSNVLVDFGAGNGVLANYLDRHWPKNRELPIYWAVDMKETLDQLSLPARVHNRSKKYTIGEFYDLKLEENPARQIRVVIRNTLHHMTMSQCAEFFEFLKTTLPGAVEIYIQDMEQLAIPERENVAWKSDLLSTCFSNIGFDVRQTKLLSHGGVPWFSILLRPNENSATNNTIENFIEARASQYERVLEEIQCISGDYNKTGELMTLQHDLSILSQQLRQVGRLSTSSEKNTELALLNIPAKKPQEPGIDFTFSTETDSANRSGLIAMLSSKKLLEFPTIIDESNSYLAFGGYSIQSLFLQEDSRAALVKAVKRGVQVNVMLVDPDSDAASIRSLEPVYSSPQILLKAIRVSIESAREFYALIARECGEKMASSNFSIRASNRVPTASYFVADETCYLSMYTMVHTGSAAPCFVFRAMPGVANNYYHTYRNEFDGQFSSANCVLGS